MKCCIDSKCNVAFMMNTKCYHVACISNDLCVPTQSMNEGADEISMVLVQPTDDDSWEDVLAQQGKNPHLGDDRYTVDFVYNQPDRTNKINPS